MKKLFYFIIILIFGACSVTTKDDTTSSTTMPDYETATLSGKMVGVAWTFDTGNVVVPTSGSTYWYNMTSDNLSNACSSSYTGTSSNLPSTACRIPRTAALRGHKPAAIARSTRVCRPC